MKAEGWIDWLLGMAKRLVKHTSEDASESISRDIRSREF
jgi:hypothetical protein